MSYIIHDLLKYGPKTVGRELIEPFLRETYDGNLQKHYQSLGKLNERCTFGEFGDASSLWIFSLTATTPKLLEFSKRKSIDLEKLTSTTYFLRSLKHKTK